MSSSGKIVYALRGESGHANSPKVRSTWPKVIASCPVQGEEPEAVGRGFLPREITRATNLTLAAFPRFRLSTRNVLFHLSNVMRVRKIPWHKSSCVVVVCQKILTYDQLDLTTTTKSKMERDTSLWWEGVRSHSGSLSHSWNGHKRISKEPQNISSIT